MIKKLVVALGLGVASLNAIAATPAAVPSAPAATLPSKVAALPSVTYTADQQSVLVASEDWQQAVDGLNPKAVAALYDPHAYFYPDASKTEINDPKALYQYYLALSLKPQIQVIFDQENPRVYGDGTVAVNSGLYTFSYQDQHHKTVHVPARFTFVYVKENGQWMIVEHHSSVLPNAPKAKASKAKGKSKPKSNSKLGTPHNKAVPQGK